MSTGLERYMGRAPVQRYVNRERSRIAANVQLTEDRIAGLREVAAYGAGSVVHLRNILREVEQYNVDAGPEAGVIVRIASSGIIAAVMEFEGSL
jgi:hypothetical protein